MNVFFDHNIAPLNSSAKKTLGRSPLCIVLLLCALALFPSISFGFELSGGLSAAEEGDDRYRPAFVLGLAPTENIAMRGFYYGRSFGPVTESTGLLAVMQKLNPLRSTLLTAGIGLAVVNDSTSVTYNAPEDSSQDISESRWNAGMFTGLYLNFNIKAPVFFSMSWEAAVFPAGLAGGLFLATGRKQFLGMQVGVRL